jgi:hypothetical protein
MIGMLLQLTKLLEISLKALKSYPQITRIVTGLALKQILKFPRFGARLLTHHLGVQKTDGTEVGEMKLILKIKRETTRTLLGILSFLNTQVRFSIGTLILEELAV